MFDLFDILATASACFLIGLVCGVALLDNMRSKD